jgi:hypothetical protein
VNVYEPESARVPSMKAGQSSGTPGHIGHIVVRDVPGTRLPTAFPDCEIEAVGTDSQITFELRDLADAYGFLDRVRQIGASLVRLSITESPSSD